MPDFRKANAKRGALPLEELVRDLDQESGPVAGVDFGA